MSETLKQGTGVTRIAYGEGESQFGDLRVPRGHGPHPLLIVIHGGFWYDKYGLDLMDAMSEDFTSRGYATWNIEYRRVGEPGGGWPGTLLDVADAVDAVEGFAKEYNMDLRKVITIGHSAGGHLALWAAARHRIPVESELSIDRDPLHIRGVVSLAGVADLKGMWDVRQVNSPVVDFLGGTPTEMPERYELASPIQLLPIGVPQVLIHGTEDDRVPCSISDGYYTTAMELGDPVAYVELPEIEHFKLIDPTSEAWPAVVEAVAELSSQFS